MPLRILDDAFVPDERKAEVRKRLARAKGQVEGVERMLDQNRPCVEILTQISAAHEALRGAGRVMVRNYLERCASRAIKAGREQEVYDEMMDVIFKGADGVGPAGYSEVSLTLDNSDHALALNFEEITITRRLHRDGVGEYFINRSSCRLKPVSE